jgi:hypothetical protein
MKMRRGEKFLGADWPGAAAWHDAAGGDDVLNEQCGMHCGVGCWQGGRRCAVAWLSSTAGLRGALSEFYTLMKLSRSVLKVSL